MPRPVRLSRIAAAIARPPHGDAELVVDERHFDRVVLDGMLKATTSIDIATADFKAMLVPSGGRRRAKSIIEVLRRMASAGVEIRLLHSGVPSTAALAELRRELPESVTIRRCPRLHAKAVIIDCRSMYLGSANLTGAGLGAKSERKRNFELGLRTRSPALIEAVLDYFNAIWEGRRCDSCRRHAVCPAPLEEPALAKQRGLWRPD